MYRMFQVVVTLMLIVATETWHEGGMYDCTSSHFLVLVISLRAAPLGVSGPEKTNLRTSLS